MPKNLREIEEYCYTVKELDLLNDSEYEAESDRRIEEKWYSQSEIDKLKEEFLDKQRVREAIINIRNKCSVDNPEENFDWFTFDMGIETVKRVLLKELGL
jgi:hypothetical protein